MRRNIHRGRLYDSRSIVVAEGVYRGVFYIDGTSLDTTDGMVNEATREIFSTRGAAEDAADAGARRWIDSDSAEH